VIENTTVLLICALITSIGLVGGWVFKLSTRLATADAKADAAAKDAQTAALTVGGLEATLEKTRGELVAHQVLVAREYASNQTIQQLEDKLIKAVDRLGDRLDKLFSANPISV
jgi:multidrug resistance efflux pump